MVGASPASVSGEAAQQRKKIKKDEGKKSVVGATGIEPVTPTV